MAGNRSFFSNMIIFFLTTVAVAVQAQQCGTSQRRAWRDLSCQEQRNYLNAVQALKDNGIYDELVRVHWDSRARAHGVPEFLPWHRWFVWVYERELQRVSSSCVTVPYWDWERGDSLPIMLKASTFGTRNNGGCVPNGIAEAWDPAQPGERCLFREFNTDWEFSLDAEVLSRITNFRDFNGFGDALEGSPHAAPHEFIGGPMGIDWSPDDPLFWVHHSNVDRIWALWQDYRGHDEISDPDDFGRTHFSSNMDRPLVIFQGSRVSFDDPRTGQPPTPRDLLTSRNGPLVDVQYVNDSLARLLLETSSSYRNGGNNGAWISPASGRVTERCQGDNGNGDGGQQTQPAPAPSPSPPSSSSSSSCRGNGRSCSNSDACCSGFCSARSRRCASPCLGRGSRCDDDSECCSRRCSSQSSRCARSNNRLLRHHRGLLLQDQEEDGDDGEAVVYREEPLDFSNDKVKSRWYELIAEYPDDVPAVIWEILAREDCEGRAQQEQHEIRSASAKWIEMMHMGNNTRVFDCHYVLH